MLLPVLYLASLLHGAFGRIGIVPGTNYCERSVQSVDNPSFKVCGPPGWICFQGGNFMSDIGDEHDCDPHPYLMKAAHPEGGPPVSEELFLDIGSNVGQCSLQMLSKGYRAILAEKEVEYLAWANASIYANPEFLDRAQVIHGPISPPNPKSKDLKASDRQKLSVDKLVPAPQVIRLWKVDVDGNEIDVLKSAEKAFADGRVDVIHLELIGEEVAEISRMTKVEILAYLETVGFLLYAQLIPDRLGVVIDHFPKGCMAFSDWTETLGIADISRAWINLPDVPDGHAVIPAEEASRYEYGSKRAKHFEYIPFCTNTDGVKGHNGTGAGACFMQYIAVRKGSTAAKHPFFAGHQCTVNFVQEVRKRLNQSLKDGHCWKGEHAPPMFNAPPGSLAKLKAEIEANKTQEKNQRETIELLQRQERASKNRTKKRKKKMKKTTNVSKEEL